MIASFFVRSRYFQIKRGLADSLHPPVELREATIADFSYVLGESISTLMTDADPRERPLLRGKIENLRLACGAIHGRALSSGATFSFWRHVGAPRRSRGFVMGREVREGCIVPSIGGGLCQLSGSLLEAAVQAGLEVVELHRHTALPADVGYDANRDATVFWNYVDLRLRADRRVFIEAFLTESELVVRLRSELPGSATVGLPVLPITETSRATLASSCYSCGQTGCVRHPKPGERSSRD